MELNEEKTKIMIFNFNKTKQFSTRITLKNKTIETLKETKLLGTVITDNLKWNKNTRFLCKKAYGRMQVLQKAATFTSNRKDLIDIYKAYVRSVAEQSCVVWNSSLTKQNITELERIQKVAVRIILGEYHPYSTALKMLNLETLKNRRYELTKSFAKKCINNKKTETMFKTSNKKHIMELRHTKQFEETFAKTRRLKMSAIPQMQKILNSNE